MFPIPDKINGNQYQVEEFNPFKNETINVIESSGSVINSADDFQLSKAVCTYGSAGNFYQDNSAGPNVFVLGTVDSRLSPAVYSFGMSVRFIAAFTNTGPATINVAGLGVKNILLPTGGSLPGSSIVAGQFVELIYTGATAVIGDFVIVSDTATTDVFPRGHLFGLKISPTATSITVDSGDARSDTNVRNMVLSSTIMKDLTLPFSEGTGNGGYGGGAALAINKTYSVYLIVKEDGTTDVGIDDNLTTAANLLSVATGFVDYRRIGYLRTELASTNFMLYEQLGDLFRITDYTNPNFSITHALDIGQAADFEPRFVPQASTYIGVFKVFIQRPTVAAAGAHRWANLYSLDFDLPQASLEQYSGYGGAWTDLGGINTHSMTIPAIGDQIKVGVNGLRITSIGDTSQIRDHTITTYSYLDNRGKEFNFI